MKNLKQVLGIFVFMLLSSNLMLAQSPHKMSYQAVVRNSSFNLVVSSPIGMKVSILQGSATGTSVYSETHTPSTNANGLATVEIGGGTVVTGDFSTINWATGPYFVKTETDPNGGTNYSISSVSQFMSVPYAMYALNSGSSTPGPQGPAGPAGPAGPQGPAGLLSVNCLDCHNHDKGAATYAGSRAEKKANATNEYPYSVHGAGEAYLSTGTNPGCAVCHSDQGYIYKVKSGLQPTYTYSSTTSKYSFSYNVPASASSAMTGLPGRISCYTCHKSNATDTMAMIYTDTVKLALRSFPGKEKYFYFAGDNGKTNLCVSCHQARPYNQNTTSGDGSSMDYTAMALSLGDTMYSNTKTSSTGNKYSFSRFLVGHYGWVGNVIAGVGFGGIEIPGPATYTNSFHKGNVGCIECHMAPPTIASGAPVGGHTFSAMGNFRGCNTVDCHSGLTATNTKVTTAWNTQKALVDTLGGLLISQGSYLISKDTTLNLEGAFNNLWYKWSSLHFDGYLNIGNAAGQFQITNGTPNAGLVKWPTLTNGQFGALQAMTVALRESSGGIHNTKYTKALLTNAIAYLRTNPIQ
ncbi:MAG: hypothetical protein SGJ00_02825 [bacterium]|nr:hypothetical protein [bacterium]